MTVSPSAATTTTGRPVPGLGEIFLGFFLVGVVAFGGSLPIARRTLVERRKWLAPEEFTELLALAQFLPGPNMCNLSIVVGKRFRGAAGALAGALGLMIAPSIIVVLMAIVFGHYADLAVMSGVLAGLAAAAAGLILAMAARIAEPMWRRPTLRGWAVAGAAFASVGLFGLPLVWTMVVLIPISVALAWNPVNRATRPPP